MNEVEVLKKFLLFPLWNTDAVFEEFRKLDGAIFRENPERRKERFLFIEGSRPDKVVLVAHADTAFDEFYGYKPVPHSLEEKEGIIRSKNNGNVGLGADDRAGCAMLWLLRESGHSILIADGEEGGGKGSRWLVNNHDDILETLNNHQFMIQLDRRNGTDYKCYSVGTSRFREFITAQTGYREPDRFSYTDIVTLCRDICGVNFSIGYYNEHTANEYLVVSEWRNTLKILQVLLNYPDLERFVLQK
jgi:hypothetical protein